MHELLSYLSHRGILTILVLAQHGLVGPMDTPLDISYLADGVLMLRYLGKKAEADKLEKAVAAVIAEGKNVTYDMKPNRDDPTAVGTSQMADAIIKKMK